MRVFSARRISARLIAVSALILSSLQSGPVSAAAPPSQYAPVDVKSGVVVDRKTGLTWERLVSPSTLTFSAAQSYCSRLQLNGVSGWRLPTIRELQTLLDPREVNPSIDRTAFPSTPFNEAFWTSSPYQKTKTQCPACTWMVDFKRGTSHSYDASTRLGRVRCVRKE